MTFVSGIWVEDHDSNSIRIREALQAIAASRKYEAFEWEVLPQRAANPNHDVVIRAFGDERTFSLPAAPFERDESKLIARIEWQVLNILADLAKART